MSLAVGNGFIYKVTMPGLPTGGNPAEYEYTPGVLQIDNYNPELFRALAGQRYEVKVGTYVTLNRSNEVLQVVDYYENILVVQNPNGAPSFCIERNGSDNKWRVSTVRDLVRVFGGDSTVKVLCHNGRSVIYEGPEAVNDKLPEFSCAVSMVMPLEVFKGCANVLKDMGWREVGARSHSESAMVMLNVGNENGEFGYFEAEAWLPHNGPIVGYSDPELLFAIAGQRTAGNRACRQLKTRQWYCETQSPNDAPALWQLIKISDGGNFVFLRSPGRKVKKVGIDTFWGFYSHATVKDFLNGWPKDGSWNELSPKPDNQRPAEGPETEGRVQYLTFVLNNGHSIVFKVKAGVHLVSYAVSVTDPRTSC